MKLFHISMIVFLVILLTVNSAGCLEPGTNSSSDEFYAELPTASASDDNKPAASEITGTDSTIIDDSITAAEIGDGMIGQTVTIRGRISEIKRFESGHASALLTDKSGRITLYFHRSSNIDLLMLITGHEYKVNGTVDSYNGELEILPQNSSDIELISEIIFEPAEVVKVVDGDTIHAKTSAGEIETIRMIGVDTPELAKDGKPAEFFAEQAHEFTARKLMNQMVYLEQDHDDLDQYGRKLRYVWINQPQAINEQSIRDGLFSALLISNGCASFVQYNDDRKYKELLTEIESEAQDAGIGIWE